jgi:hypothetical protein
VLRTVWHIQLAPDNADADLCTFLSIILSDCID